MPATDDTDRQYPPHKTTCGRDLCQHDQDIRSMQKAIERHSEELANGRVDFAEIRKDLQAITSVLQRLEGVVHSALSQFSATKFDVWDKVKESVIFWLVPLCGTAFLWVLWASKQIPGAVHP
jgi:hypothetical protein